MYHSCWAITAHISPETDFKRAVSAISQKLAEYSPDSFDIRIFEGPFTSICEETHKNTKEAIKTVGEFQIKEDRTLEDIIPGVFINNKNGLVHEFDSPVKNTTHNNDDVLAVIKLPKNISLERYSLPQKIEYKY